MGRLVVPHSSKHDFINDYLEGGFQKRLMDHGLKYVHASGRGIKTGEYSDDRICAPREGFWDNLWNGPEIVADIDRLIEGRPKLEIRVINPDYKRILSIVVEDERRHSPIDISIR